MLLTSKLSAKQTEKRRRRWVCEYEIRTAKKKTSTCEAKKKRKEEQHEINCSSRQQLGIGLRNALLVHIPSDMKFFRSETMGKTIIMGRKTLESFPQAQPLAGRNNIVITKDPAYQVKGAVVVHSIEEAIEESKKYDTDVYCIGGESVYRQLLPYCDEAFITKIDHAYEADSFFPNLDEMPEWEMTETSDEQTYLIWNILSPNTKESTKQQSDFCRRFYLGIIFHQHV